ncbi:hypothetical protein [Brachyspira pilosicoli]|uniref:hypothetical protein n=1 Tax=Brachyspira pilosicoli TaxID=52584 RepID=UPI0030062621
MRIKTALIVCLILIVSCKKINLLSSTYIPPPTEFPNETPEYPESTPVPTPPQEPEEKPIEVKPEVVENGTVFGGYGRRFKFKNDWYVLATNEYEYKPETKTLNPTGKGAVLRIEKDGKTITKIHSLKLSDNLEQTEYWTNLNSKKLIIEANKVSIPSKAEQSFSGNEYKKEFEKLNFADLGISYPYFRFGFFTSFTMYFYKRESDSLINWAYSANIENKTYNIPKPNVDNPTIQGRYGMDTLNYASIFYIKGKLFIAGQKSLLDDHILGYRDPKEPNYSDDSNDYYLVDITKDVSDNNNWVKYEFPFPEKRQHFYILYDKNKLDKVYVYGGKSSYWECVDVSFTNTKQWRFFSDKEFTPKDGIWSTEDGINWKKENNIDVSKLECYPIIDFTRKFGIVGGYEFEDGTPFEPSYTELNGKYYRTFNSTYPMPPIKEIMETVDKFETNFTATEEHIKKSGYYQLQMSSVSPDKAQESDWVNIMPNNETSSSIGWESGGADLFTLDGKIVRLVDYDREFKLDNQYETALALAEKYYNLLLNSPISEFKKYDYYFLYYKAMADMLKIIKDKGNNYFRPDEAVTHYTFEL